MYQFLILVYPLAAPSWFSFTRLKVLQCFFGRVCSCRVCDLWFALVSDRLEATMDGDGEQAARAQLCVLHLRSFQLHLIYDQADGLAAILYYDREKFCEIFLQTITMMFFRNWIHRPEWPRPSVTWLYAESSWEPLKGLQHPTVPAQIEHCWCCVNFNNELIKINN